METTMTLANGQTVRILDNVRDAEYRDRLYAHNGEACTKCGRKVGKNDLWVFHVYGTEVVHVEDVATVQESDPRASYVGWYRIGPSCARKLPRGYAFTTAQYLALNGQGG